MSKINDGGSAFPEAIAVGPAGDVYPGFSGMSLRDWFAGQALPAVVAATSSGQHHPMMREGERNIMLAVARDTYELADAMLRARSEPGQ